MRLSHHWWSVWRVYSPARGAFWMVCKGILIGGLLLLLLVTITRQVHSPFVPSVADIGRVYLTDTGLLLDHMRYSITYVMTGFMIALIIGFGLGTALYYSPVLRTVLLPILNAARVVAALSLFPLIILIFGLGLRSKVFIIIWTAWPAACFNMMSGLNQVDQSIRDAVVLETSSRHKAFVYVMFPLAIPSLVSGAQIALSGGWISLIAAEMLGGSTGIGYYVLIGSQTFNFPAMYAGIGLIALTGVLLSTLIEVMARFLFPYYQEVVQHG